MGAGGESRTRPDIRPGLAALGAVEIAIALFQVASPHAFYVHVGPFDVYNPHYVRDLATYGLALGAGLIMSVWRPSWRLPVLAITAAQFVLHTINHAVDVGAANPRWLGWANLAALAASSALVFWMLAVQLRSAR